MGNLFSRAFKRLTQGSNSTRNQSQQQTQQQGNDNHNETRHQTTRPTAETIPVGQSIDSAEYAALETNSNRARKQQPQSTNDSSPFATTENNRDDSSKRGAEEAAIKIQALIRGHLTRKALKDANSHDASQQPAATSTHGGQQVINIAPCNDDAVPTTIGSLPKTCPLESIAEVAESCAGPIQQRLECGEKKKLALLCPRSGASSPCGDISRGSTSPVPSENQASIDLNCESPTSASIDIVDHNVRPTDKMASVLHHRVRDVTSGHQVTPHELPTTLEDGEQTAEVVVGQQEANRTGLPPVGTPDSLESEEAAAIRIQSAFRGYRTRKNSPYRTRSPNSLSSQKRQALTQQEATILDENDELLNATTDGGDEDIDNANLLAASCASGTDADDEATGPFMVERRSSRTRHRDCAKIVKAGDDDEQLGQEAAIATTTSCSLPGDSSMEDHSSENADTVKELLQQELQEETQIADTNATEEAVKSNDDEEDVVASEVDEENREGEKEEEEEEELEEREEVEEEDQENNKVEAEAETVVGIVDENNSHKPSLSLESGHDRSEESTANLVSEDSSAALEAGPTTSAAEDTKPNSSPPTRASFGGKSEASVDTDFDGCALEEVVSELEQVEASDAPSELQSAANLPVSLDEEEQRTIEMESDDIERRDPRGQVSEERVRSPQINLEEPKFTQDEAKNDETEQAGAKEANDVANLTVDPSSNDGATSDVSGRSTPNLTSSAPASSSDEADRDSGHDGDGSPTALGSGEQSKQDKQQPPAGGGKSQKKRNRNKKKGKK